MKTRFYNESDSLLARLAFRLRRPLSLLNFNYLWFRFRTVQEGVFMLYRHLKD